MFSNIYLDRITIKENIEALSESSREVDLEVNTEKTKYMVGSHHQNAWRNHNLLIANKSFENGAKFKYLETIAANQSIHQVKSRLNLGIGCYHCSRVFCLPVSPLKLKD
jgi:hypothetical protein